MFYEPENLVYVPTLATVEDCTDFSITGQSKKLTFEEGGYIDITFDEVVSSDYQELTMYIYTTPHLPREEIFSMLIDGVDYNFNELNKGSDFIRVIFDCTTMDNLSTIRITPNYSDLVIFIDYIGFKKTEYANLDISVLESIKSAISLNYGVTCTLKTKVNAGSESIQLESTEYLTDDSELLIEEGENSEIIRLLDYSGKLRTPIQNTYTTACTITVNVPVCIEDEILEAPDPMVGINLTDIDDAEYKVSEYNVAGSKNKKVLGNTIVNVFIESSSKLKLLALSREYQLKYGLKFSIKHDGERIDIISDEPEYIDLDIGTIPRVIFQYSVPVSALTESLRIPITEITYI